MKAFCMIPARGGSKRCPGKNTRPFVGGPSLTERAIQLALNSGLFDKVVVSSDDSTALMFAEIAGAVAHKRPPELCTDGSDTEDVILYVAREFPEYDTICCLYPQAGAWISINQLQLGAELFASMKKLPVVSYIAHGRDAGQFYWLDIKSFGKWRKRGMELLDMAHVVVPISAQDVVDINTEEDWKLAEQKYGGETE